MTGTPDGKIVLLPGTSRSMERIAQRVSAERAIVAGGDIDAAAAAKTRELIPAPRPLTGPRENDVDRYCSARTAAVSRIRSG